MRSLVQLRRGLLASALGAKISTIDGGLTAIATGTLGFARRLAGENWLFNEGKPQPTKHMKPNSYYRRPDRLVGEVDPRGRFSRPVYNQLMAETWFYRQRLQDAAEEILTLPTFERTVKALYCVSLRWGVSGVQLMKQLKGVLQ